MVSTHSNRSTHSKNHQKNPSQNLSHIEPTAPVQNLFQLTYRRVTRIRDRVPNAGHEEKNQKPVM